MGDVGFQKYPALKLYLLKAKRFPIETLSLSNQKKTCKKFPALRFTCFARSGFPLGKLFKYPIK